MTGKNYQRFQRWNIRPGKTVMLLRSYNLLTAIIGFFIPTLVTATLLNRRPLKLLGYSAEDIRLHQVVLVVLLVGAALLVASSLSYFTNHYSHPGNVEDAV